MMKIGHIVIFFLVLIALICMVVGMIYARYPLKYDDIVEKYAIRYNIDESLIFAIIKVESNFNESAKSSKGAIGLMQLMPSTAKWLDNDIVEDDLYNASSNISIGVKYIAYLMQKYDNDVLTSLAAYNAGEGTVDRWIQNKIKHNNIMFERKLDMEDIEYDETSQYVEKVRKCIDYYEFIYNL